MKNINAYERGRVAYLENKLRQPMDDILFANDMYAEVRRKQSLNLFLEGHDAGKRKLKDQFISEWKAGWDDAKDEAHDDN